MVGDDTLSTMMRSRIIAKARTALLKDIKMIRVNRW
jgi:hypothetical protein